MVLTRKGFMYQRFSVLSQVKHCAGMFSLSSKRVTERFDSPIVNAKYKALARHCFGPQIVQ